jgi:nucleoside-diphosphate-sugar epimerase
MDNNMSKKTIFITGSRGFIGRHLLKALDCALFDVIEAEHDELPDGPLCAPDYIVHLAGTTTTSDSFIPELWHNNVTYSDLIMAEKDSKIIYASSTSAAELTNPYAYTKRYLEFLGEQHGNAVGLRFFNVYGPGNNKGIVNKAIQCAKTGETMQLWGGGNIRDFIYIDDVVRSIIASLEWAPGIYDVGTGRSISTDMAVCKVAKAMGVTINCNVMPPLKTDMKYSVANPGIEGCLTFEQGLERMLKELL